MVIQFNIAMLFKINENFDILLEVIIFYEFKVLTLPTIMVNLNIPKTTCSKSNKQILLRKTLA